MPDTIIAMIGVVPLCRVTGMASNLFDSVHHVFQRCVQTEPHNHVVFALWALHAHVYRKFEYTPRLSLQSPTPDAGKTTVLRILRHLTPRPC
jgi:hypothetical protein